VSYGLGVEGMRATPPDLMVDSLVELHDYLNHGRLQHSSS
jgi:hypothetical protein